MFWAKWCVEKVIIQTERIVMFEWDIIKLKMFNIKLKMFNVKLWFLAIFTAQRLLLF